MRSLVHNGEEPTGARRTAPAEVHERDGVVIVTPTGPLPDPLPQVLTEQLEQVIADRPVIVDLSSIVVASAAPLVGLAAWVLGSSRPGQSCVVCASPSARAQLRRWHITRCLAVFGSIGDALQARRFAQDGYGRGWCPDAPASALPDSSVVRPRGVGEGLPRPLPLRRNLASAHQLA